MTTDPASLRAENARLREALEAIAGPIPKEWDTDPLESVHSIMRRIARAALAGKDE